ncbi:hypothetical protein PHYBOEH_006487 [Phytophthora boehmeriae]|uniref:Uncharacterized protein n=1 Tax=Phytophthora boehmeriae TaxID=109152 RepID=A0A8T1WF94_9STRA|nr:hypothetical protein PHYBOEH_006487 [Phytophthora boehmeriae]
MTADEYIAIAAKVIVHEAFKRDLLRAQKQWEDDINLWKKDVDCASFVQSKIRDFEHFAEKLEQIQLPVTISCIRTVVKDNFKLLDKASLCAMDQLYKNAKRGEISAEHWYNAAMGRCAYELEHLTTTATAIYNRLNKLNTITTRHNGEHQALGFKMRDLYKAELSNSQRQWQIAIRANWDDRVYAQYFRSVANGEADIATSQFSIIEPNTLPLAMKMLQVIPAAFTDMQELIKTNLQREQLAMATTVELKVETKKAFAHALIKTKRIYFEYVAGTAEEVAAATDKKTTVFSEPLERLRSDYMSAIRKKTAKIASLEVNKKMLAFDDHRFTYKAKATTSLDTVVNAYRTAHE